MAVVWRFMWGRGLKGTMVLALVSAGFQSLPLLPIIKLGTSGADSWVDGFMYVLGSCGSLQQTLLWGWEFLPLPPQPPQVFNQWFEALFPHAGTLSCTVCRRVSQLLPCGQLHLCPPHSTVRYLAESASHCLGVCPLRPSYRSGWLFLLYLLVVGLPYSLIFFQWLFFVFKLLFSFFGCTRRHSVSTCASILARSHFFFFLLFLFFSSSSCYLIHYFI